MGVLITTANFIGRYAIPQSAFDDLDSFIDDTEEDYLNDLLGAELYADFKENLNPVPPATPLVTLPNTPAQPKPVDPGYLNIYNPFTVDYGSKIYKSNGMVKMLLGFIFFDFMRQVKYKATGQGMTVNSPDTSKAVDQANLYAVLNEATATHQAIQTYITSIKPELFTVKPFNGQEKSFSISMFG